MDLSKWIKRQVGYLSLAMAGVEKNALGQDRGQLSAPIAQERRHTQGTLADSLLNGVVTAEVEALRWRTYSVLEAAKTHTSVLVGYDDKGKPIYEMGKYDPEKILSKIKIDSYDEYPLEMVIDNQPITTSILEEFDKLDDDRVIFTDTPIINTTVNGESATHAEFKQNEHVDKIEHPVKIEREYMPNFQIENFAAKLNIRKINSDEKLLEFYINKYPDEDNRTTRLLLSEIKKAMVNPRASSMLDIKEVGFITYKALGVNDFLEYQYKITFFDKIIEFGSYYVIKFKAEVIVNGKSIVEQYRDKKLDEKYKNKEAKSKTKRI